MATEEKKFEMPSLSFGDAQQAAKDKLVDTYFGNNNPNTTTPGADKSGEINKTLEAQNAKNRTTIEDQLNGQQARLNQAAGAAAAGNSIAPKTAKAQKDGDQLIPMSDQIKMTQAEVDRLAAKEETPEMKKKREKRERAQRIIGAVSDGISALSNLYFTTQYAPNMYNPNNSAVKNVSERQKEAQADRDKNHEQYINMSLKLGDLQAKQAKTAHEQKMAEEEAKRKAAAEKRAQDEHDWKAALQPDIQKYYAERANNMGNKAVTSGAEAEYADDMQEQKLNNLREQGETQQSIQTKNYSSANRNNRSGNGSGSGSGRSNDYTEEEVYYVQATDNRGNPKFDADGNPIMIKKVRKKTRQSGSGSSGKQPNPMGNGEEQKKEEETKKLPNPMN